MKYITQNQTIAQNYITTLTGSPDTDVTFQTFGDKDKKNGRLANKLYGSLRKHADRLSQLNDQGAGIFVMINEGDQQGRSAENVIRVRALFADFDGTPHQPAAEALKPHIIVQTSPGKYHLYWLVVDCSLNEFSSLQKAIAKKFGSDTSVHDLSRVMRLPGFYHQKTEQRFLVNLVEVDDVPPYSKDYIKEVFELDLSAPETTSPVHQNDDGTAWHEFVDQSTGEIVDLTHWAAECPDFKIIDVIRQHSPSKLIGNEKNGKQHIVCPFHHEHTQQGQDKATFCINGTDAKNEGFVIHCMHEHCADRDRLHFIKRMLQAGWFPVDVLTEKSFLANPHIPKWIKYDINELNRCAKHRSLLPFEKTIFAAVQQICFTQGFGVAPDDDRLMSKLLGIDKSKWCEIKNEFLETKLIRQSIDSKGNAILIHDGTLEAFQQSQKVYERQARTGRRGGLSKKK